MKYLLLFLTCLPFVCFADDWDITSETPTSRIEANMCIPAVDFIKCLHVDEDVAGLVIEVLDCDGTQLALYDDATEQEDIATIGTYAAPSANNVRVSPQANSGSDLTQMMFADAVYAAANDCLVITVTDNGTTIGDFRRYVFLSLPADSVDSSAIAANAITSSEIASNAIGPDQMAANAIGASELAQNAIDADSIASDVSDEIWDEVCEDQGTAYSCREAISVVLAEAAGQCNYNSSTRIWTCSDPGGNETRFTITYGASLDGDRDSVTITPVTP